MLSTTDKMLFLKRVSIFSGMSLEQVRVLTSHLDEQHFLPGELIFNEGDFSQELYILVAGQGPDHQELWRSPGTDHCRVQARRFFWGHGNF